MEKSTILRKLDSAFSFLIADIPEEVKINGEHIRLKKEIERILKTAEDGDKSRIIADVVRLERDLNRIINDFKSRVKRSEIDPTEAEAQLGYYLGIRRAIAILRGISDESLRRFSEKDEKREIAEDRKRWFDSMKQLDEG